MIVVLDEADGLPSTDALNRLVDVENLSVVVICHDPDEWLPVLTGDSGGGCPSRSSDGPLQCR